MAANHPTGSAGGMGSVELDRDTAGVTSTYGQWSTTAFLVTFNSGLVFNVASAAAGDYVVNDVIGSSYAGGTVTLDAQDATNPRIDQVVVTSSGTVSVLKGTPAGAGTVYVAASSGGAVTQSLATGGPLTASALSTQLVLARIYVPASGTPLSASSITDRRTILRMPGRKGTDIASASTLTLANDDYYHVTGTTNVTAFSARPAGYHVWTEFDSVTTLTHNATSFILPGGSNLFTRAGAVYEWVSEGSGNWRMVGPPPTWQLVATSDAESTIATTGNIKVISNLNIPTGQEFMVEWQSRKDNTNTAVVEGMLVNATEIFGNGSTAESPFYVAAAASVADGYSRVLVKPRQTNYFNGVMTQQGYMVATGSVVGYVGGNKVSVPNAAITSLTITCLTNAGGATVGVANARVYVWG